MFGGALSSITNGSEIGDIIFGASWYGLDPYANRHLVIRATGTTTGNVLIPNGSVGIGTTTMDSNVLLKIQGSTSPAFEVANSSNTRLQIGIPTTTNDFAVGSILGDAVIRPLGGVNNHNGLIFYIPNNNNDGNSYFAFGDSYNNLWMKIYNNKTMKIDGKLFAKEIEVKTNVWADFVFKPDYQLMPLTDLEHFIKENNHLPGVPTETEVKENGINVAEMNAKLLQKIEELTLYVIEQQKQIDELNLSLTMPTNQ